MFVVAADVGQAMDPTAIAALEATDSEDRVRHLERIALGTKYPAVIRRIGEVVAAAPGAALVIDATGVGRATVDHLEDAGLSPIAVTITGGRETHFEDGIWLVPKGELIRPLALALEGRRLRVARGITDAAALLRELRTFVGIINRRGHARFEGKGAHDDLVIAVALAVWWRSQADSRRIGYNKHLAATE